MSEKPIIFSGPMVRAILDGRKTQTRRVIKHPPSGSENFPPDDFQDAWFFRDAYYACAENDIGRYVKCPYGKPGDRLWVRETWREFWSSSHFPPNKPAVHETGVGYRADNDGTGNYRTRTCFPPEARYGGDTKPDGSRIWKPSIHMPRWASRLTLEICSVRVERVQSISGEDARAEGISRLLCYGPGCLDGPDGCNARGCIGAREGFRDLWNQINAKREATTAKRAYSWESNPWVWVIEFRRIEEAT